MFVLKITCFLGFHRWNLVKRFKNQYTYGRKDICEHCNKFRTIEKVLNN